MLRLLPWAVLVPGGVRLISVFLSYFLLAVALAFAAEKVVLQLRWEPQFQFAGYYAALWQGYYAEAGLDVEIRSAVRQNQPALRAVDEVAEGRAQFGIGAADVLVARDKGLPLTVVGSIFQHSPVAVIARKDTDVFSPADLTRIRLRRVVGDIPDIELVAMLRAEGIDPSQLKARFTDETGENTVDLLASGKIDAYVGYPLTANWQAKQRGLRITTLRPATYGVDFYGDSLFTREQLAGRDPELVKRFVKASLRGWKFALENSDAVAKRLSGVPRTYKVGDVVAFNRLQAREVVRLVQYPDVPLGQINPHRWHLMHDHLRTAGLIRNGFDARFLFDPQRDQIETQRAWINFLLVTPGLTALLALLAIGLTWTVGLRRQVVARTAELMKSEERYRTLVETMRDGIGVIDNSSAFTFVNKRTCEILGYDEKEILGRKLADLMAGDDEIRTNFRERILLSRAGNQTPYEVEFMRKDGERVCVLASPQLILDKDGTYRGVFFVFTDVTRLKSAQEALHASERRFRLLLDNARSSVHLKDLDGHYILANKRFKETFNVTDDDLTEKKVIDLFPYSIAQQLQEMERKALAEGTDVDGEFERVRPDGRTVIDHVRKFPVLDENGNTVGVATIAADITEQRMLENQLAHAQKMEAVGQLTGGIAHEFNNILAIILGSAELLKDRSAENRDLVDRIRRAGERGANLTHRLLAYSRRQPLQPVVVGLGNLISETGKTLKRMLGETIAVDVSWSPALWPTMVDRGQLENVILNLAVNSRDAMPLDGILSVKASNVTLSNADAAEIDGCIPGDYVLLSVADTGIGMPPNVAKNAFNPFFTTKDVGEGSGLGLSMVYGFAKQSGGAVCIDSRENQGTTVKLYLPRSLKPVPEEIADGANVDTPKSSESTVLVVEDDAEVRELVVSLLGSLGYTVLHAEDGPSALEYIRKTPEIDLLFSDVVLPSGMSGPNIAREARFIRPDLKVVFSSGYPVKELETHAYSTVDPQFLRKPYRLTELADVLETAINS